MVTQGANLNWTLMQNQKAHLNGTLMVTQATPLNQTLMDSKHAWLSSVVLFFGSGGTEHQVRAKIEMCNYY